MASIDGKQIANMLYHAGVETLLTIGFSELMKKLLTRPAPKEDFLSLHLMQSEIKI